MKNVIKCVRKKSKQKLFGSVNPILRKRNMKINGFPTFACDFAVSLSDPLI